MRLTIYSSIGAVVLLLGCTHASVSSVPIEVPGVGLVYRYQGRANFSHQIAEADRVITEECKRINGGRPVIVNHQMRNLGMIGVGNSTATTTLSANATSAGNTTALSGTANTNTFGTSGGLRNMNQELLFKCVPNE